MLKDDAATVAAEQMLPIDPKRHKKLLRIIHFAVSQGLRLTLPHTVFEVSILRRKPYFSRLGPVRRHTET
jgi:hypothetical protein